MADHNPLPPLGPAPVDVEPSSGSFSTLLVLAVIVGFGWWFLERRQGVPVSATLRSLAARLVARLLALRSGGASGGEAGSGGGGGGEAGGAEDREEGKLLGGGGGGGATTAGGGGGGAAAPASGSVGDVESPRALPAITNLPAASDYRPLRSGEDLRQLLPHLPSRCMGKDLPLLFSTQRDGYSLSTLYSRARGSGATLLVVLDESQSVFGGFASRDWSGAEFGPAGGGAHAGGTFARGSVGYLPSPSRGRGGENWFGSGDAFLFTLRPGFAVHRWTRSNNDFQLAHDNFMALGGGGGRFGLWLDGALEKGTTAHCETYGNPPLTAGGGEGFRVVRVELYGFGAQKASLLDKPKGLARHVYSLIQERRASRSTNGQD